MRFTTSLMAMWTHAEHEVAPDQMEPGIAPEDQAHEHVLDLGMYGLRLRGEYVPMNGLAVAVQVPIQVAHVDALFHDEQGEALPTFESIHHRDELLMGIGDPEVTGIWQAIAPAPQQPWALQLALGLSLPLGGTEPDPFVLGMQGQTHQHIFFGTGTFDPVARLQLRYGGTGWSSRLWASARVPLYPNSHGYTGPGVIEAGWGVITPFGLDAVSFLFEVGALKETPAKWRDEQAKNSGRTEIMANLGASWVLDPNWTLSAMVKRPLYTAVLGGQMEIPLVSMISVTYGGSTQEGSPAPGQ